MRNHIESVTIITSKAPFCKRITSITCSIAESFWSMVEKSDGCWCWKGQTHSAGYGRIERNYDGGKFIFLAHRISWQLHFGDIPEGYHVLHRCDNPPCSNPRHLFLGTQRDNNEDKINKDRHVRGERAPIAKLTDAAVVEIRRRYKHGDVTQQLLADESGVCLSQICGIVNGKAWKHVTSG